MAKIHVLHENAEWVVPLEAAFREQELFYQLLFLDEGGVALARFLGRELAAGQRRAA